ncbi:Sua5 family C-terminal domain-containing protein, partial [Paenibacillus filicis]
GADRRAVLARMCSELEEARARGERTGALLLGAAPEHAAGQDAAEPLPADYVAVCGSTGDLESVARGLYGALRSFDEAESTFIVAEACPEEGIGEAVMNRLRKAAAGRVISV